VLALDENVVKLDGLNLFAINSKLCFLLFEIDKWITKAFEVRIKGVFLLSTSE
jgi:hypothetical protein